MSVVVRMEMPKACSWIENGEKKRCPIAEWGGACAITKQFKMPDGCRPSWCPIICSLPEGHGRLVDADKEIDFHINDFERIKTEGIDVYSKAYSLSDLCDGITYAYDHADIIVPAETERSET